jgi:tetratricopeptide (TPR) repeat protein
MARPRDAVIRYNLGCVLTQLDTLDIAEAQFRIAVSLDPSLAEGQFNIAHIRRLKDDAEGEKQALEQALAADPEYVEALVALARWLIARDRFTEVRPLLDRIEAAGTPEAFKEFVQRAALLCDLSGRLGARPR